MKASHSSSSSCSFKKIFIELCFNFIISNIKDLSKMTADFNKKVLKCHIETNQFNATFQASS